MFIDLEKAKKEFLKYDVKKDEYSQRKIYHSLRVMENSKDIAQRIGFGSLTLF